MLAGLAFILLHSAQINHSSLYHTVIIFQLLFCLPEEITLLVTMYTENVDVASLIRGWEKAQFFRTKFN